jgi:hypothetical protein
MMIILHNSMDRDSQDFVKIVLGRMVEASEFIGGVLIVGEYIFYDWYKGGREAWWSIAGTKEVSAFPSVIVDIPGYDVPGLVDADHGAVKQKRVVPAEQYVLRKPESEAEVQAFLNEINLALQRSKNEAGRTVTPDSLTLENMNQADTGRK